MRNVTVKRRGKRTQSKVKVRIREKERERGGGRDRDRHGDGGGGGGASWSADRSPEVVIYSIVSISQQQLQPSFFISLHSLRTERYFCPSEPNRHSR